MLERGSLLLCVPWKKREIVKKSPRKSKGPFIQDENIDTSNLPGLNEQARAKGDPFKPTGKCLLNEETHKQTPKSRPEEIQEEIEGSEEMPIGFLKFLEHCEKSCSCSAKPKEREISSLIRSKKIKKEPQSRLKLKPTGKKSQRHPSHYLTTNPQESTREVHLIRPIVNKAGTQFQITTKNNTRLSFSCVNTLKKENMRVSSLM